MLRTRSGELPRSRDCTYPFGRSVSRGKCTTDAHPGEGGRRGEKASRTDLFGSRSSRARTARIAEWRSSSSSASSTRPGIPAEIEVVEVESDSDAEAYRVLGSPTVLRGRSRRRPGAEPACGLQCRRPHLSHGSRAVAAGPRPSGFATPCSAPWRRRRPTGITRPRTSQASSARPAARGLRRRARRARRRPTRRCASTPFGGRPRG